jgi:superfamily II DNA helicase RecQ
MQGTEGGCTDHIATQPGCRHYHAYWFWKDNAPIIASQLETDHVTIVVLPLKSLMFDYMRRLKDMGITYEVFLEAQTKGLSGAHNLVLVSADMRKSAHWKQCLAELNERKPVVHTIFDEGQYAFTANDFHSALCHLDEIQQFLMQLIVMSGTIPPHCEQVIIESFGLNPKAKNHSQKFRLTRTRVYSGTSLDNIGHYRQVK